MSDNESIDFFNDDEQSDLHSNRSRLGSESQIFGNDNSDSLNMKRQESNNSQSGMKSQRINIDLKSKLRRPTNNESSALENNSISAINYMSPPPVNDTASEGNYMVPSQETPQSNLPFVDPSATLRNQYPTRYFIFKNMKPNQFKLAKEYDICITQKVNEDKLKFAYNV